MKHFTLPQFWKYYDRLPRQIQLVADKNYRLLKSNPQYPSLHIKKIGTARQLSSLRVGIGYRALGLEKPDGIYWFWLGSHVDYDRLIAS